MSDPFTASDLAALSQPSAPAPQTGTLERLVGLAKEPSSDKRRELLREVTDIFLEKPEAYSPTESSHFGQIMAQVAGDMAVEIRKNLAQRFAYLPEAPKELIDYLIHDEIEVAALPLQHSPVVDDEALLSVANQRGQEHLMAMTKRETLSEVVTTAIVEKGSDVVLGSLVKNKGATISRDSMERIVDRAEENAALHEPLVGRPDLPPDLMNEMFFYVSAQLKKQIMARNTQIDDKTLEAMFGTAERRARRQFASDDEAAAYAEAVAFIEEREAAGELTESLVINLWRQNRVKHFTVGFARLAEIELRTAIRMVTEQNYEGLAIVAKACGFDTGSFAALVSRTGGAGDQSPEVMKMINLYAKLPAPTAQRTLRFWKVRHKTMTEESAQRASAAVN